MTSHHNFSADLCSVEYRHNIHTPLYSVSSFWGGIHQGPRTRSKSSPYLLATNGADNWQSSDAGGENLESERVVSISDFMAALKDVSEQFLAQVLIPRPTLWSAKLMKLHDLQGLCLLWAGTSRDSLYHALASQFKEFKIEANKFFPVADERVAQNGIVELPSAAKQIRMEILRYIAAKADLFREENKLKTDAELDAASQRLGYIF